MRFITLLLVLFSCSSYAVEKPYVLQGRYFSWPILAVQEDSTFIVDAKKDFVLPVWVKVAGVDTPAWGDYAKCPQEKMLAARVYNFIANKIIETKRRGMVITFENLSWGEHGGYINADVYLGATKLSDILLKEGLAKEKDIYGKPNDWCFAK